MVIETSLQTLINVVLFAQNAEVDEENGKTGGNYIGLVPQGLIAAATACIFGTPCGCLAAKELDGLITNGILMLLLLWFATS